MNTPIIFVDESDIDSSKIPIGKTSEFYIGPDGKGFIKVNKNKKDEFEIFWKWHEEAHSKFWNKLLKKYNGNVKQALLQLETIRNDYPDNEEERFAFAMQFKKLKSGNRRMSNENILEILEAEYKNTGTWNESKIKFFRELLN